MGLNCTSPLRCNIFQLIPVLFGVMVESLQIQKPNCMHCTVPFYMENLGILDLGSHARAWNQCPADT